MSVLSFVVIFLLQTWLALNLNYLHLVTVIAFTRVKTSPNHLLEQMLLR